MVLPVEMITGSFQFHSCHEFIYRVAISALRYSMLKVVKKIYLSKKSCTNRITNVTRSLRRVINWKYNYISSLMHHPNTQALEAKLQSKQSWYNDHSISRPMLRPGKHDTMKRRPPSEWRGAKQMTQVWQPFDIDRRHTANSRPNQVPIPKFSEAPGLFTNPILVTWFVRHFGSINCCAAQYLLSTGLWITPNQNQTLSNRNDKCIWNRRSNPVIIQSPSEISQAPVERIKTKPTAKSIIKDSKRERGPHTYESNTGGPIKHVHGIHSARNIIMFALIWCRALRPSSSSLALCRRTSCCSFVSSRGSSQRKQLPGECDANECLLCCISSFL